jgi:Tfp pilus assembly protein PilW
MAVSMVLLAGMVSAFSSHAKTNNMQVLTVEIVHWARTSLASMTREIQMAGYRTFRRNGNLWAGQIERLSLT